MFGLGNPELGVLMLGMFIVFIIISFLLYFLIDIFFYIIIF